VGDKIPDRRGGREAPGRQNAWAKPGRYKIEKFWNTCSYMDEAKKLLRVRKRRFGDNWYLT
jgi:hypothetical protein